MSSWQNKTLSLWAEMFFPDNLYLIILTGKRAILRTA
ncbi:MAG: hypothetical protein ACI8P3_004416 [Saprospiraceae bacterium]